MAVPKRKSSKSTIRSRKASHRTVINRAKPCPQCGEAQQPHRACPSCGFYRGRQVLSVSEG